MKTYRVTITAETTYLIDAPNAEDAEQLALEYFDEYIPNVEIEQVMGEVDENENLQ